MSRLWAELKRRQVFKVGTAYLVVGWLVIEVADTLAPQLGLPAWAPRLVTFLILLGFPVALVLAWIFDLTPDGVRVEARGAGSAGFYALVGVVAALALAWLFVGRPDVDLISDAQAEPPSIAVLPFVNLSPDPENEYFADGIAEELLNILAGVDGLKVASRTSAFSFKGTATPLPEIARQLGVRHVLEGSVRRQGSRVRITAQLIEAGSDDHLWSQTYDRELTDIFQVQEDIARAITDALADVLGHRVVTVEAPTDDLAAYDHYLRGRRTFFQRRDLDTAVADLRAAVERDPRFAAAWGYLAATGHVIGSGGYPTRMDRGEAARLAEAAADRALALDPALTLAMAVKGVHTHARLAGLDLLQRAAAQETQESTARLWLGLQWLQLGYREQAMAAFEAAHEQDPLVPINNGYLGFAYFVNGREQAGLQLVRRAVEMTNWATTAGLIAIEKAHRGEHALAAELYTMMLDENHALTTAEVERLAAGFAAALDEPALRAAQVERMRGGREPMLEHALFTALAFADAEVVFPLVDAIHDEPGVLISFALAAWLPSLDWLREDPRFFALMRGAGIVDYWQQRGPPPDCRIAGAAVAAHLECNAGKTDLGG